MNPASRTLLPRLLACLLCAGVLLASGPLTATPVPARARPAAPFTLDFPRLGMWWPDTSTQPLSAIARYDWVIFGSWDLPRLPAVKALNPQLLALNSTNACELGFNPDPDAEPWDNADVLDIPPQWFLTQAGSRLRAAVDAVTPDLPVDEVQRQLDGQIVPLFVVSDTLLIDGESVLVLGVNTAGRTLHVQRGYVRPASAHPAGTRVAAHVTFWPHSWVLNLSTLSPTAVADPAYGAETWIEYNARRAARLLDDPLWDGILVDRSDPNESWLINGETVRSIDPDQSNTLLGDYTAFDAAWNAGLRQYESLLRSAVGEQRLIFANWGMPNYDLLNGNNFEGFPGSDTTAYGAPWRAAVFGPSSRGSYFDWLGLALQPNLTMIETYEDDSGADPLGDGSYDNPCTRPGFTPNYRKMRFGLATALLGDGFFSYEINTNGHGSLCLLWFDEYDNAGQGRGYLGQPLGPAQRTLEQLPTPDRLQGGDFETPADLQAWNLWVDSGAGYAAALHSDSTNPAQGDTAARIDVTLAQGVDWQVGFSQEPVVLETNTEYTLSFWARAAAPRPLSAWAQQSADPWQNWLYLGTVNLTTQWQHFTLVDAASGADTTAQLVFGLGQQTGSVWLDGVHLQAGSLEVWQRDYQGGRVLLNASLTPQSIPLGAVFRKIAGNQAPQVNNGSLVEVVDLPPHDGLVLLRLAANTRTFLPAVIANRPLSLRTK
jgi:hypothetical protein